MGRDQQRRKELLEVLICMLIDECRLRRLKYFSIDVKKISTGINLFSISQTIGDMFNVHFSV